MVDYAERADFARPRRRRRSPDEIAAGRKARAEARTDEEWYAFAKDVCYRQLAMMERSTAQLREALERNLVPEPIAEEVVAAFIEADLVNDARFAHMFVRSRFAAKPTTRRALRQELARKGITGQEAEDALAQIDPEEEQDAATDFALRKMRSMRQLEPHVQRRRLYGALGRRGFSPSQISQAMERAMGEAEESDRT
ncbi:regulatory protein RecX [Trueperella bialowiezensis]|uniref:Regulatory protein RecX n=1 Tax=Trueperella bialowiezensis TaxID=312285 RepID=A0A3S4VEW2_9ACTO|nr:regulatory protein RecX [Trueperella bialowiezensis]VEI12626.1 Regulatory protein recX [Trueperella bialowiezensis]